MLREISISFLKQKICKPFGNADSLPDFQKAKGFENEVRKEVYIGYADLCLQFTLIS